MTPYHWLWLIYRSIPVCDSRKIHWRLICVTLTLHLNSVFDATVFDATVFTSDAVSVHCKHGLREVLHGQWYMNVLSLIFRGLWESDGHTHVCGLAFLSSISHLYFVYFLCPPHHSLFHIFFFTSCHLHTVCIHFKSEFSVFFFQWWNVIRCLWDGPIARTPARSRSTFKPCLRSTARFTLEPGNAKLFSYYS